MLLKVQELLSGGSSALFAIFITMRKNKNKPNNKEMKTQLLVIHSFTMLTTKKLRCFHASMLLMSVFSRSITPLNLQKKKRQSMLKFFKNLVLSVSRAIMILILVLKLREQ